MHEPSRSYILHGEGSNRPVRLLPKAQVSQESSDARGEQILDLAWD